MVAKALRFGLIGCGDIAERRVAPALASAEGSRLGAVARARPERAAEFAARHGAARWYSDWRELVRDPEIDAVYVATPVHVHAEQAVAAARAGKHVLVEKPMALSVAECEAMVAAACEAGVRLGVAYYRHLYPAVGRLRELLASGELGSPVLAQVQAFEYFDPQDDHPRAWLLDKARSGGGPMMDFGCHRIEMLLDLFGPASHVRGFPARVRFRERAVEDTCVAHLRFERGGEAVLSVSHAVREARDSFQVFGSEGSVHLEPLNSGRMHIVTANGVREEVHPPHANLHQPIVEDFVAAVAQGRAPAVPGEAGLAVNRVLAAVYA
jgi:predicted dehydrogenase